MLASVDGEISPPGEATISILDDGLLRGDGAFEVIKLYGGDPFRLEDHYARLGRSAAAIELEFDLDALRARGRRAASPSGADPDGCLRVVVTRGGRRVLTIEERARLARQRPHRARHPDPERDPRRRQVDLLRRQHAGDPDRRARGTPTRPSSSTRTGIVLRGADLLDLLDRPADGTPDHARPRRRHPRLDHPRRGHRRHRRSTEGSFGRDELLVAEEAFLASTTREIQPIAAIDGTELPIVDGPAAERASAALREAIEAERARAVGSGSAVRHGPRPQRRAAADLGDGAAVRRRGDRPAGARAATARSASTPTSPGGSARWATSARRSPRSTAAAASTTSPTR